MTALRGVNLGGWLVLERWMTPGVFKGLEAKDEYGLVAELGSEAAKERLKSHRNTFITESDFKYIADQGFDLVRLPVGYWLFEDTKDYIDGEEYVDRALSWSKKYNLGVIIDLHGLPGSQNGKIHSGQIGQVRFYEPGNQQRALNTLEYVAARYGKHPALRGLQVINEPELRIFSGRLHRYYRAAHKRVDGYLKPEAKVIVSDGYQPRRMAWELSRRDYGDRLVLDTHIYQIYSQKYRSMSWQQHMDYMDSRQRKLLGSMSRRLPIMVGEWSGALPSQVAVNDEQRQKYIELQQEILTKNTWAWAYWSYKTGGSGAWNARSMIESQALHVA